MLTANPSNLSLLQIVVALLIAVCGSSVIAAYITIRGTARIKTDDYARAIENEVRASLRAELEATEKEIKAARRENDELRRRLDRYTDNLVRFTSNVLRLTSLIRKFIPRTYQILADEIDAEGKRLVKLLGADLEAEDGSGESVSPTVRPP